MIVNSVEEISLRRIISAVSTRERNGRSLSVTADARDELGAKQDVDVKAAREPTDFTNLRRGI
tara:strand:- start:503 stop:691 length:189 start_codon:yes stop_codon:yes gene_type:complete